MGKNETKESYDKHYNSDEVQDWMNAPLGKPKAKTQTNEIGQVERLVSQILEDCVETETSSGFKGRLTSRQRIISIAKKYLPASKIKELNDKYFG